MSFEVITTKLLESIKSELKKEEHINTINNDIIKPIVDKVLEQLYPYFIGASLIIAFIVFICSSFLSSFLMESNNFVVITSNDIYY